MVEQADEQLPPDEHRRRWPLWVAAVFAAAALVAMVVSVGALRSAERSADRAEGDLMATRADIADLDDELAAAGQRIDGLHEEVVTMRSLLQPGTPAALQAAYLQVVAAGCADPHHDVEAAIAEVADSDGTAGLLARPGWEAAIDRSAVARSLEDCERSDG